jgi:hypothetical protein
MTNGTPPAWPDQGGNIVIINGGASEPRIIFASGSATAPPASSWFPDFSTGAPPIVELGGWAGPPPGPPTGTGLVTGPGGEIEEPNGPEEPEC